MTLLAERLSEEVAAHCTPVPVDCKINPDVPAEPVASFKLPLSWNDDVAVSLPTEALKSTALVAVAFVHTPLKSTKQLLSLTGEHPPHGVEVAVGSKMLSEG